MYSRSYYAEDTSRVALPGDYNGTAFMDQPSEETLQFIEPPEEKAVEASNQGHGLLGGFEKIPFLSAFFGPGWSGGLKMPTIGVEEILIIATAAFLFFSKDGDKESAIILLLLLLIN